jgi:hypothetical protein
MRPWFPEETSLPPAWETGSYPSAWSASWNSTYVCDIRMETGWRPSPPILGRESEALGEAAMLNNAR